MTRTLSIVLLLGIVITAALVWAQPTRPRSDLTMRPQTEADKKSSAPPRPEQDQSRKTPPGDQQDAATIRLETTLVVVPVSVLDRDGKYVPNLTQGDFHLYEDGVEQETSHFDAVEVPFNVVLLLDASQSARFRTEDIRNAALAFVEQLRPQDRVMVVSFDSRIYIDSEFTSDRAQLRRAIYRHTQTGGGTRLYDAVDLVLTERLKQIQGRKAVILFTDGVDTESRLTTASGSLELVEESGVLVYAVQYNTSDDAVKAARVVGPPSNRIYVPDPAIASPEAYHRASQYLVDLTERAGARLYQAQELSDLNQSLALIAEELRHQYAISYYPTNTARDGSYRRLRVTVSRPNAVVRARSGYRAVKPAPTSVGPPKKNARHP